MTAIWAVKVAYGANMAGRWRSLGAGAIGILLGLCLAAMGSGRRLAIAIATSLSRISLDKRQAKLRNLELWHGSLGGDGGGCSREALEDEARIVTNAKPVHLGIKSADTLRFWRGRLVFSIAMATGIVTSGLGELEAPVLRNQKSISVRMVASAYLWL